MKYIYKIQRLIVLSSSLVLIIIESAWAMQCGTHLITANEDDPISRSDVESKCGSPDSKSGNTWIYIKGNEEYRLIFDENGLRDIFSEMKQE